MMMLAIQLGVIIFAARLGSILFEKMKLPGVLGELCSGILIGPYLLGGIPMIGLEHGLFPVFLEGQPIWPELYGITVVASIVLLFMVGLETDIRLFMRYSLAGSMVGIGGVTVSFLMGNLGAVFLLRTLFHQDANFFTPACLLLGVISTATSVGITARVLSKKDKLDSPEGVTILAGAVVDDVLGIIMLAICLGVISSSQESGNINWGNIGIIAAKAVGIWLTATIVGLAASQRISILLKWFKDKSLIAVMALGLALILAGLFEEAKLAMIIGAYVMGLALARADINYVIREKIDPIHAFLVPVFFCVMGMMVNVKLLLSAEVIMFGLAFTMIGITAKVIGCAVPALFCNFSSIGALRVGCGMLPRGEVTLIIAGVGLANGYVSSELFGSVVFMTLFTTIVAPIVLVKLFDNPAEGLRKPVSAPEHASLLFSFPSSQTADLLLRRLLGMFEAEGFFVHLLNRELNLFQLRKDAVVINVSQIDGDLHFECQKADASLVNTAMLEVIAELEQILNELKKPIDRQAIRKNIQSDESAGKTHYKELAKYISVKSLVPCLVGQTKEEIIDELLATLRKAGKLKDIEDARNAVMAREESMSTGMQYGVAIPHGRTDAVKNLVCAVGIKTGGVDFAAIDGNPSDIIVLTLSPKSAAAPHVQFMSMISHVLNERGRTALRSCQKAKEMHDVITGRLNAQEVAALIERKTVIDMSKVEQEKAASLSQYLIPELICPDLKGGTKTEVIQELLNLLDERKLINNMRRARADIMNREKQMSSGMAHGVAIPHARTDAVSSLVCAVGVKRDGLDFGSLDGEPARIIVLTLSPKDTAAPHVRFMAMISRALNDNGRAMVLEAREPGEIMTALLSCGSPASGETI
ncbi:hypothetical protein BVX97_06030 [bacterium E08(2017)]|nr:hypothetical protein BVX97_06030 [bacterium E08(2017)]